MGEPARAGSLKMVCRGTIGSAYVLRDLGKCLILGIGGSSPSTGAAAPDDNGFAGGVGVGVEDEDEARRAKGALDEEQAKELRAIDRDLRSE